MRYSGSRTIAVIILALFAPQRTSVAEEEGPARADWFLARSEAAGLPPSVAAYNLYAMGDLEGALGRIRSVSSPPEKLAQGLAVAKYLAHRGEFQGAEKFCELVKPVLGEILEAGQRQMAQDNLTEVLGILGDIDGYLQGRRAEPTDQTVIWQLHDLQCRYGQYSAAAETVARFDRALRAEANAQKNPRNRKARLDRLEKEKLRIVSSRIPTQLDRGDTAAAERTLAELQKMGAKAGLLGQNRRLIDEQLVRQGDVEAGERIDARQKALALAFAGRLGEAMQAAQVAGADRAFWSVFVVQAARKGDLSHLNQVLSQVRLEDDEVREVTVALADGGHVAEAEAILMKHSGEHSRSYLAFARALAKAGDRDGAKKELKRAMAGPGARGFDYQEIARLLRELGAPGDVDAFFRGQWELLRVAPVRVCWAWAKYGTPSGLKAILKEVKTWDHDGGFTRWAALGAAWGFQDVPGDEVDARVKVLK